MSKTFMNKLFVKHHIYSLKMQKRGDLQAQVNAFNNILADLTQLGVKGDDEDKAVILLYYLPRSYDHLVTTLTYGKESITMDSISSTVLQHSQHRQSVEEGEGSSGECLFAKGGHNRRRVKGKVVDSGKKNRFKFNVKWEKKEGQDYECTFLLEIFCMM